MGHNQGANLRTHIASPLTVVNNTSDIHQSWIIQKRDLIIKLYILAQFYKILHLQTPILSDKEWPTSCINGVQCDYTLSWLYEH